MEDAVEIVRLNIEYYKKLYEKDPDEPRRQMLMRLLDEEQAKWCSLVTEPNITTSNPTASTG
jgi:hypothetical protein